ncbi:MAG: rhodanese-like domain-containing protein [Verrucomicrobiota bacterium]
MKKLILLLATAMLAVAAYAGEFANISITDLKSAIAAKQVVVLDANGSESWHAGHIPGAIDYQGNKQRLATLLPSDKGALIVAYCGGPRCRAYQAAAQAAVELGYTNVKHLSAGISGWKQASEKVDTAP